jgi:transcriptional regulator GlxA family with amidase domain
VADVSSPVEVLRAAADRLDQLAESTSPSPWEAPRPNAGLHEVHDSAGNGIATESDFGDLAEADADWIAMLGPQVAPALSAWLRESASIAEYYNDERPHLPAPRHALAFARMVLGLPAVSDTTGEACRA